MAGRTHVAEPGATTCPVGGCSRPAGFATDHEGAGPCRRHSSAPLAASDTPTQLRVRVLRVVLASCARQAVPFEEAWRIAVPVALNRLPAGEADPLRARLDARLDGWQEAYEIALRS